MSYLVAKLVRIGNPEFPLYPEFRALCVDMLGFPVSTFASTNGQRAGLIVDKSTTIPLESMGEGVASIVGLVADICIADRQILVLEEPENDIHPTALKKLLDVIVKKSAANQFLVSTHSNIVLKYLGAPDTTKVFQISGTIEDGKPTSTCASVTTTEDRLAVLDDLGYELFDFDLWEGWLILEESSAETVIREHLIRWFAPKLARARTVAARGASRVEAVFDDFDRLFCYAHLEQRYHGRAWVIADGDDAGTEVIQRLTQRYGSWAPRHFRTWPKEDFELYYPAAFQTQVRDVLGIPDRRQRQRDKAQLLKTILDWIESDEDRARTEFELSAAEVIAVLREIESDL
jgi:hypothetical protein